LIMTQYLCKFRNFYFSKNLIILQFFLQNWLNFLAFVNFHTQNCPIFVMFILKNNNYFQYFWIFSEKNGFYVLLISSLLNQIGYLSQGLNPTQFEQHTQYTSFYYSNSIKVQHFLIIFALQKNDKQMRSPYLKQNCKNN